MGSDLKSCTGISGYGARTIESIVSDVTVLKLRPAIQRDPRYNAYRQMFIHN